MSAMDSFAEDIAGRVRWALAHNSGWPNGAWSTGEKLAVALVLDRADYIDAMGYTCADALDRLAGDIGSGVAGAVAWVQEVRKETVPPTCEADGVRRDDYDNEHYWNCAEPGTIDVDGTLMCEDHAGEQGHGPKQEEYGYDPHDGLNPTPETGQ